MRGIILAGGTGTRLHPLTLVTNKHLLPVYNKPMIYYPIEFLRDSGITDLMVILGGNSIGDVVNLLGDGAQLGVDITYRHQARPDGIAGALKLVRNFVGIEPFAVCLGDNIFSEPIKDLSSKFVFDRFSRIPSSKRDLSVPYAKVFLSKTDRPESFGVPEFDCNNKIFRIDEKPEFPKSDYAVTGLYIYDKYIWDIIDQLQPSARGEFEITDISNQYIQDGILDYAVLRGWWADAGTIVSLSQASRLIGEQYANKG